MNSLPHRCSPLCPRHTRRRQDAVGSTPSYASTGTTHGQGDENHAERCLDLLNDTAELEDPNEARQAYDEFIALGRLDE